MNVLTIQVVHTRTRLGSDPVLDRLCTYCQSFGALAQHCRHMEGNWTWGNWQLTDWSQLGVGVADGVTGCSQWEVQR